MAEAAPKKVSKPRAKPEHPPYVELIKVREGEGCWGLPGGMAARADGAPRLAWGVASCNLEGLGPRSCRLPDPSWCRADREAAGGGQGGPAACSNGLPRAPGLRPPDRRRLSAKRRPLGTLAQEAITALHERGGSSLPALKKYLGAPQGGFQGRLARGGGAGRAAGELGADRGLGGAP